MIRVANAPVSYGAFELTVGLLPNVPGPEEVLDAIADAGYAGTELGPRGYLGEDGTLRDRLGRRGLALVGGFVPLSFGEDETFLELDATLDILEGFGAKPILADAGPRAAVDWARLTDGVARAAALARARGFEPTFHHHMGSRVQTPSEIERLLDLTDVGLLLDTGHLAARRGVFCELGAGDVDLEPFFAELNAYSGWLVVEQDWVPGPDDDASEAAAAQARNRHWLAEHVGL